MAATGTPTPNIGLRIPQGTDPASVDDINYNSNLLDTKLGAVGNDSVQDQIDDLNSNIENKLMTFDSKSGSVAIASANGYGNIELTFTKPANSTVVGDMITLVATTISANDIVCCVPIERTDTTVKYRVVSKSAQTITLTVSRIYRL